MTGLTPKRAFRSAVAVLFCCGAVALARDTYYQGQDFEVFWRAAREVLAGQPAYDLVRDGKMSFKYPPWVLPVFFPFALLPLGLAKALWAVTQLFALVAVVLWLFKQGCRRLPVFVLTALFWGIWAVHAMDGQVMLPLLALTLWAGSREGFFGAVASAWAMSVKVFTAPGIVGGRAWKWQPATVLRKGLAVATVFMVLSVPACITDRGGVPASLVQSWAVAASSGGELFAGAKVRGRDNQGLPALVLRVAGVPPENAMADLTAFLLVLCVLGLLWMRASAGLEGARAWAGWLAIAAAAHPLAWFHNFVLAFPLAVFAVDDALLAGGRAKKAVAFAGVVMLALVTRKTLGTAGAWLELLSIKAIGAVFCAVSLVMRAKK